MGRKQEAAKNLKMTTKPFDRIFCLRNAVTAVLTISVLGYTDGIVQQTIDECFNLKLFEDGGLVFKNINDLHFDNGDFIMMSDKTAWMATSPDALHTVQKFYDGLKVVRIAKSFLIGSDLKGAKFEPEFPDGWSAEQAFALMRRLQHKDLPYGSWACNASHYMRYIIYATRWAPKAKLSCPLRRDLRFMSVDDINAPRFFLLSGSWKDNMVYMDKIPILRQDSRQSRWDDGETTTQSRRPPKRKSEDMDELQASNTTDSLSDLFARE